MSVKKHNNTVEQELKEHHFRVSIFGSARIKKDDELYKQVYNLAESIAQHNIDIVTGGGPGIMEAANEGHKKVSNGNSHSIGLTIRLPHETKGNKHLDIKKHFDKFSNRLDHFMALSNAIIIMPGGIGTCLELFYSWQLSQVKHICHIPIILHGEMWDELLKWVKEYPLKANSLNPEDLNNIFCVSNNKEALEIILDTYKAYQAGGEDFCVNYKKYKPYLS